MTDLNEADVERRLARLRDEYDEFPVDHREETWTAEKFEEAVELARDGYTGGGYVLAVREPDQAAPLTGSMPDDATQDGDRVLLAMTRGTNRWGPPGGGREDGETYEEAAVREVREETSVDVEITDVREATRWYTAGEDSEELRSSGNRTQSGDDDRTVHTLFVVFDGRYEGGHVEVQPGELNGVAWFRELPANLHPFAERFAEEWDGGRAGGGT